MNIITLSKKEVKELNKANMNDLIKAMLGQLLITKDSK